MAVKVSGVEVIDNSRNITTNIGTVDGRDIAADGAKLDGIEAGADVTDAVNVEPLVDTHLNTSSATSGQYLGWNGADYAWSTVSGYTDADVNTHLNTSTALSGEVLSWNGSDYDWVSGGATVGNITGTTLDLSSGTYFNFTPTSASNTFVFSNPATSGDVSEFTLELTGANVVAGYDLSANANSSSELGILGTVGRYGFRFSSDGTKAYTVGSFEVKQLELGTAYQLETATSAKTYSTYSAGFSSLNSDVSFNSTGTKMYVLVRADDVLIQFSLGTAWDISTASYDSVSFSLSTQDSSPFSMTWGDSGSKFYTIGLTTDDIFQYNCSTPYDLSTASYSGNSISTDGGLVTAYTCIRANSAGTSLYVFGTRTILNEFRKVNMSTAWDLSTASLSSSVNVTSYFGNSKFYSFDFSGTNLTMIGQSPTETTVSDGYLVAQRLTLSTSEDLASTLTLQSTTPVSGTGLYYGVNFNNDGTRLYSVEYDEDYLIYSTEFSLSTPYDANTIYASARHQLPSVSGFLVYGIALKTDGTKLWVLDSSKNILQWSMSTAWDLSTLSKDATTTSLSSANNLRGLQFSPDGTKIFTLNQGTNDSVNRYDLSTAWDITTQSLNGTSHTFTETTNVQAMTISSDGLYIYTGDTSSTVREYALSTAYDLSTVSYVTSKSAAWSAVTRAMVIGGQGANLLIATDNYSKYTHNLSTSSAATFTYPVSVKWPGGTAPTAPGDGETDLLQFVTRDGGTTYYAYQKGDNFS